MTVSSALVEVPRAAGAESALADRLRVIQGNRAGSYAVHVHLSELRRDNRKPEFIRIAALTFETLVNRYEATLFVLANSDLALLCRDVPVDAIDRAISRTRSLFNEDPLTAGAGGTLEDRFTTWYDLSRGEDYSAFRAVAEDLADAAAKRTPMPAGRRMAGAHDALAGTPLTPGHLATIGVKLQGIPLGDLIHRQSAIEVHAGGKGEVVFQEHYISIADLQKRVAPEVDLLGNRWLFQYLTETLDRRMLTVLAGTDFADLDGAISVNLNVSTVLSPSFRNLHRTLGHNASQVVVEMQVVDIFADMGAFTHARDSLRDHGYRVLIDGLTPLSLRFFDPLSLAADFVKIGWSPDLHGVLSDDMEMELRDMVDHAGKDSVILARVDCEEAVEWGLGVGISRFQGHFIDKLVDAMSAKGII
ncbi:MAG: EAL domain-containing protein [Proteobacteria bacterium]|nr:EAL domain-containing protein [Pseudomonadota bacterium]